MSLMKPINQNPSKISVFFRRYQRLLLAFFLIALSLTAAVAIMRAANRSTTVWAARSELMVGVRLSAINVASTSVLLPKNSANYLSDQESIIGSVVTKAMSPGDLIAAHSISRNPGELTVRSVPFQVARNDLPFDLTAGEKVDIYSLPVRALNNGDSDQVVQSARDITVESLDLQSRNLGGSIGVVLHIEERDVLGILADTANTRIVLVRSAS